MSTEKESPHYEEVRRFRQAERRKHLEMLTKLVEEAIKMARSHNTPAKERLKWVQLTGRLLWYKDQVLRSLTHESLEKEVADLKREVADRNKPPEQKWEPEGEEGP